MPRPAEKSRRRELGGGAGRLGEARRRLVPRPRRVDPRAALARAPLCASVATICDALDRRAIGVVAPARLRIIGNEPLADPLGGFAWRSPRAGCGRFGGGKGAFAGASISRAELHHPGVARAGREALVANAPGGLGGTR